MNKQVKQIRNEVERLIKWCNAPFTKRAGVSGEEILNNLLSFIDSIEEPEVDLEKTLIGFQNRYAHENSGELPSAIEIAIYFFELGLTQNGE